MQKLVTVITFIFALCYSQSPCPSFFRYMVHEKTKEIYGKIEIPFPPKNIVLHLRVSLSVATALPTRYVGKIELARSKQESIKAVNQNKPLIYNVFFPVARPIPLLTEIMFNQHQYCIGPHALGPAVTNIFLEHFLHPPKINRSKNTPPIHYGRKELCVEENKIFNINRFMNSTTHIDNMINTTTSEISTLELNSNVGQICGQPASYYNSYQLPENGRALPGQWPWLAAIFLVELEFRFQCVGNLITDRHILTAAHCKKSNNRELHANHFIASLGRYCLDDWKEKSSKNLEIEEFLLHPEYENRGNAHADLALIFLKNKVHFTQTIKPVCLWTGSSDLNKIIGTMGYVIGWGHENNKQNTRELRMTKVPIISQEACLRSNIGFFYSTSSKTFCAGNKDGQGPCDGDSGGGLVIWNNTTKRYHLRGIVSLSLLDNNSSLCDLSEYIVYVDVAKFLDWIKNEINNHETERNAVETRVGLKMIYSWIVVSIFFFLTLGPGSAEETSDHPISTKEALHTVGKYLKEDGGTVWLSSLTAKRLAPLTTDQLMVEILNSTDANEEVKAAASVIKTALDEQKIAGSNSTGIFELEGWKDLVDNVEDQDDIICLYRKSLNVSFERTEDWQKFLKSMSAGYTVYLALDMGQKYVICLKKIQISEQNSSFTGARALNSTELKSKIEDSTSEILSKGSRSLNEKSDSTEESEEEEKCDHKKKPDDMNMRRQFSSMRPAPQESPCSKPIIYMLPYGFYNWPPSGNYPTPSMESPAMIPSSSLNSGSYPQIIYPSNQASGLPNVGYPITKSAPLPPGPPRMDYLFRSDKSVPRLPISSFPGIKSAPFTPRPPISNFPIMRSATAPPRQKIPTSYQDVISRKQLPGYEMQRLRQYPNRESPSSNIPQAPISTRGYTQPPRRFFPPPTQSRKFVQPIFQQGFPRGPVNIPSINPRASLRNALPSVNDFQPSNYGQYTNVYPISPTSSDQYSNVGCKNYHPCVFPCDKPLLVRVQLEPSQYLLKELSNIGYIPQSGPTIPTIPWRRNMDSESNIGVRKGEDKDNRGVQLDKNLEKEENTSDSLERSESSSSEIGVSVAP
ncbi:uncharacterized protein [Chelonus insularis]|uniref:uncharacterized protein n=1 Tax=Chelonus insularis TaxID=460826 RepID=UPI00158EBE22|nr:uncharacterized protein LOC118067170 [Chelonus insularis]